MKRINLKKRKKHKKLNKIVIIAIILLILATFILKYVNKEISPKLINYASLEIKKLSNLIITESINEEEFEKLNVDDIYKITKNNNNEILTVDINTVILNKMIKKATENIQQRLKKLEKGEVDENNQENKNGVVLKIPLGEIYNNFLLADLGPKIPVKLKIIGNIETKINTNVKNYGINSSLIELSLDITVKEKVILPISTNEIRVNQTFPLTIKMIEGKIPNYYSNGINKSEILSIPIE